MNDTLLERDPRNVLLARGPRFRIDAETLRDNALAAAGLLNPEIGGPSIYPPQPDGVTALSYGEPDWPTSVGRDRYRRGIYTYWKRTAPFAAAVTFDAPSRESTCVRRRRSNTPLQSLTLLNDQMYLEAAQAMAWRVVNEADSVRDRIRLVFMLCVSRPPTSEEVDRVEAFYRDALKKYETDRDAAWDVSGHIGLFESRRRPEFAAWTVVCRAIMNLDEAMMRG